MRTPSSQPNANSEPDASSTPRPQVRWGFVMRASALLIVILGTSTERLPPRLAILFAIAVVAGGLLWKIPPFEVGPSPGLHNGFLPATWDRGRSAVAKIAFWGGGGALFSARSPLSLNQKRNLLTWLESAPSGGPSCARPWVCSSGSPPVSGSMQRSCGIEKGQNRRICRSRQI